MPFKAGAYKHEEGFTVMVTEDGVIMLSPNHPLSLRLSVLFDTTKWTKISQKGGRVMAVKTREEILEELRVRVGEQTDDETIAFLEDVTDTLSDLETKAKGDGTDWKTKYEENDAEWRKKYTERFYSSDPEPDNESSKPDDTEKPKTFAELFTTVQQ